MRLIDADRLIEHTADKVTFGEIGKLEYGIIESAVYNEETVDCMPIKWIEDNVKKKQEASKGTKNDIAEIYKSVIDILLKDWKREHAK